MKIDEGGDQSLAMSHTLKSVFKVNGDNFVDKSKLQTALRTQCIS